MNEKNRFNETEPEMTEETQNTELVSETEQEGDQHEAQEAEALSAPETAETAGDEADEAPAEENAAADDAETISAQEAESTEAAAAEEPVIEVSEETDHTDSTESHAAQGERIIEAQSAPAQGNKSVKAKKAPKLIQLTSGRLALLVVICLAVSLLGGLGGSYIISGMGSSSVIYRDTSGTVNATSDSSGTIKAVVESCADSVVEIQTESISSGNSLFQQYVSSGAGSGVILTQDGYIVTNHHVIEGATSILVRTRSGDEYSAELIGSDEQSDLAVLKIDASGLTPAVLGDSTKLEVGDLAVVIGNPLGELGGTVTSGIIPISNATDIIDELIANGEVTSRPTLGVSLYDVTDRNTAAQLGVDSTGVYIVQIVQGGSADRAGLQTGDRIISVDGTEVNSTEEVRAALNEHSTGEQMNMEIERDGNTIEVMVSL